MPEYFNINPVLVYAFEHHILTAMALSLRHSSRKRPRTLLQEHPLPRELLPNRFQGIAERAVAGERVNDVRCVSLPWMSMDGDIC